MKTKKLKKYEVYMKVKSTRIIEVEAASEAEAIRMAKQGEGEYMDTFAGWEINKRSSVYVNKGTEE